MIKKTLYFGNPAYLSFKLQQMVIKNPDAPKDIPDFGIPDAFTVIKTIPIEDIGVVILDHQQITITQALISALLDNNCAVITCDSKHLPVGLVLPLTGNSIQNERFRNQLEAFLPLRKRLWQQTVECKIRNQASMLFYSTGVRHNNMFVWAGSVKSGDSGNLEARAAAYYWKTLFPENPGFIRGQYEDEPNNLLNYGYAILRAVVARALVGSGMLPTIGIHHHNRYNAYCLADDIMEPYRPFVDKMVIDQLKQGYGMALDTTMKQKLLTIPTEEVLMDGTRRPLMVAVSQTTASLAKCFSGELRRICYPSFE
jgi:CRISPR-associated protein Cas1